MRIPVLAVAVAATLAACPRHVPPPPTLTALTREDRLAIAQLEGQRDAAVTKLIELADDRHPGKRALALRALGRIGTKEAVAELRRRLVGQEGIAAAAALGIAGATGAIEPADATAIVGELGALAGVGTARVVVLEAIARLGTTAAVAPLSRALGADDPEVVATAAIGLGRLGRAKVAFDTTTELALVGLTKHVDLRIRYGATYALARAVVDPTAVPAATDAAVRALRDRLADSAPVVRAIAVSGLAARRAVAVTTPDLLDALDDTDWRVAVELVRALGGPAGTEATRAAMVPLVARLAQEWSSGRLPPAFSHVLLEGLGQMADRAAEPKVRELLVTTARGYADSPPSARPADRQLGAAAANCATLAALARPLPTVAAGDPLGDPQVAFAQLGQCGGGILPDYLVQAAVFDAIAAGGASDPVKRIALAVGHGDPRVAIAAIDHVAALAKTASATERLTLRDALVTAVGRGEPAVAGSAADAASTILTDLGASGDLAPLAAAVLARVAGADGDAELTATLLGAVASAKLDGLPTCERLAAAASPALRTAARDCITALTGTDPGPRAATAPASKPPVDPDLALRATPRWRLTTSQGDVVIELASTIAPWHVAAVMMLTQRGYYDGLAFHRVVPDFVVQGGDPTGTGWGGPGFTLPSETTSSLDPTAVHYDTGAIGVADAGKDTGGSQWFAMHGPAPHLEGRYTRLGQVVEGLDVIDRLLIGDRVIRARIE